MYTPPFVTSTKVFFGIRRRKNTTVTHTDPEIIVPNRHTQTSDTRSPPFPACIPGRLVFSLQGVPILRFRIVWSRMVGLCCGKHLVPWANAQTAGFFAAGSPNSAFPNSLKQNGRTLLRSSLPPTAASRWRLFILANENDCIFSLAVCRGIPGFVAQNPSIYGYRTRWYQEMRKSHFGITLSEPFYDKLAFRNAGKSFSGFFRCAEPARPTSWMVCRPHRIPGIHSIRHHVPASDTETSRLQREQSL